MRLRGVLVLFVFVFCVSCGSKKNVATSSKSEKEVLLAKLKKERAARIKAEKELALKNADDEEERIKEELRAKAKQQELERIKEKETKVSSAVKKDYTQEYINKFSAIAVEEMYRYKIPASITLAQGVLESGSGRSKLALKSNNHFGIKCHKGWKGNSVKHDDDAIGECFRKYQHPKTSYEDHSKFLTSRSRYAGLFKLQLTDYVSWAYGLKNAGYATDKKYPNKLIAIIQKYNLDKYDILSNSIATTTDTYSSSPQVVTKTHIISKGDTLYSISRSYSVSVESIRNLNGLVDNTLSIGQELLIP